MTDLPPTTHSTADVRLTARWLALVAKGLRVASVNYLQKQLRWSRQQQERCLQAWQASDWIEPLALADGQRQRWVVTPQCPGTGDAHSLDLEILLQLAKPLTPPERLGYGYRTALSLHGLNEEFTDSACFICAVATSHRPPTGTQAFARSWAAPGQPQCQWKQLAGHVVNRSPKSIPAAGWAFTDDGIRLTSPARTLIDCWQRPGYGVSDERLLAALDHYWRDSTFGSRAQKRHALSQTFASDGDLRPERCAAFAQVVNAFDAQLADTIAQYGTA